jgi:diguanylate cyclase (GGDEF)-like protein
MNRKHYLKIQNLSLQEKLNITKDDSARKLRNKIALQEKISRYDSLKKIIEKINQALDLEFIANNLAAVAFSLIGHNKGSCMLFLVNNKTQKLFLFKTKREDESLIIKAKEGDIFDIWVLRHAQALLVEDARKDFRFDLERLKLHEIRPILSLISSPFISEHKFFGILRLDNPEAYFYTQDDLRFQTTICELGALALENAQLFQETHELALHDGLTNLYRKGYFLERLKEECTRSIRLATSLSLFMLDIDYFKNYNDKFGHTAGDLVLKELSLTMVEFLKDFEPLIISRFGGEEFCILFARLDKKKAYTIVEKLRVKIEKTDIILRKQKTKITVSIGVANFPADASDENELIFKADKAMYEAKEKGRNRVCGI